MPIQHHGKHTTPKESSPTPASLSIAAIYARVSTTDQADKGYSLPTQIDACQALAQREGYTVPEDYVFADDYTGTSLTRPQLTRLRELVRQTLVQAIVVHDWDRLSRKLAHQLVLSDEFEQSGVTLHVVTMPQGEKTPETQLLSNVRGIIAEYERAKILERTRRGKIGRAQAGYVPSGHRALGYMYVKNADKGAHYEIHLEEAALVRRIFSLYVDHGLGHQAIAALLTKEGVAPPGELRPAITRRFPTPVWHHSTVGSILRNEVYIGTLHYGKQTLQPGKSNPDKKTRHRRLPRETWIPIPVPALVSQDTFAAAQARARTNAQQSWRNRKRDYLLTGGRLRCGQCGCGMYGRCNPGRQPRYCCTRHTATHMDVLAPHTSRSILVEAVDPRVWDAIMQTLNNPALIATAVEHRQADTDAQQALVGRERQLYDRQVAQCTKDMQRWEQAYVAEVITLDDFKGKKAEIDARRASAAQELARLDAQQQQLAQQELDTVSLLEYCAQVRAGLQHFTIEEKHLAVQALNISVTWHPTEGMTIQGSIPVDIPAGLLG